MIAFTTMVRFVGWTLPLIPIQMVLTGLKVPLAKRLPMIWHRGVCRIFSIKIERHGKMLRTHPVLFVCNHSSYLDINLLGSIILGSFVAKAEVRNWPFFGLLARLQRTVFVERRATKIAVHRDEMKVRLEAGDNLILFPEGTSNDGNRVLPFKSGLFGIAEQPINGQALQVQPVSVSYTKLDGIPIGHRYRPYYAWYGDMELTSHIWNLAGLGRSTAVVEFHEPVSIAQFGSRKEMARHCQQVVAEGVSRAISGRLGAPVRAGLWTPRPA